jgi:hypothetical protein
MDDYIPVTICDSLIPQIFSNQEMMERVFRPRASQTSIPINELAFNNNYRL